MIVHYIIIKKYFKEQKKGYLRIFTMGLRYRFLEGFWFRSMAYRKQWGVQPVAAVSEAVGYFARMVIEYWLYYSLFLEPKKH